MRRTRRGRFPEFIAQERALSNWDLYSLGYSTNLTPDIRGIWSSDPLIEILASYLRTQASEPALGRYKRIALVAHSMGGLVVQRALVDYQEDFTPRTSHVMLLGTPSLGLKKARGLGAILKFQSQNMAQGSAFITDLRRRWDESFGERRPFKFWTVAGDRDQFVPPSSSLGAFARKDCLVVPGNHIEIVKPESAESSSVRVLVNAIVGDAAPAGPWNAARVAVETGDFQRAIDRLLPVADQLDDQHLVDLALALESTGRQAEAIRVLREKATQNTDVLGTLAGRLKHRWLFEGRGGWSRSAFSLSRGLWPLRGGRESRPGILSGNQRGLHALCVCRGRSRG
ncbi:MAG: tetratricopeptide repeat-containing protein [Gammaproteobacteria bacterium]